MFDFFGIKYNKINLSVGKNRNKETTQITKKDYMEAEQFFKIIPERLFEKINEKYSLRNYF